MDASPLGKENSLCVNFVTASGIILGKMDIIYRMRGRREEGRFWNFSFQQGKAAVASKAEGKISNVECWIGDRGDDIAVTGWRKG